MHRSAPPSIRDSCASCCRPAASTPHACRARAARRTRARWPACPNRRRSREDACSSVFSLAISCGGRGRAVARVEMRKFGPAAFAGKQERRLAFLPLDHLRRAEQIELHGGLVGMQIRHAGGANVRVDAGVELARRGDIASSGGRSCGTRRWIQPICCMIADPGPAGCLGSRRRINPAPRDRDAARRARGARPRRRLRRSALRSSARS